MSAILRQWLDGARQRVLWVDFEHYATRVFAGGTPDWYADANRYAAAMAQARGVIGSDVLAVDVLAPFIDCWRARCHAGEDELAPLLGENPAAAVEAMLQWEQPRAFVAEALEALFHRLSGRLDLALKLRSPRALLTALAPDHVQADDFGTLDDIAAALVNYVRTLAGKEFAALQLATDHADGYSADEWEACESIAQSARYYGWAWAASCDAEGGVLAPHVDADLRLLPDLDARFWAVDGAAFDAGDGVRYGIVPAAAVPERVNERAAALQAWLAGK